MPMAENEPRSLWLNPGVATAAFGLALVYLNLIPLRFSWMSVDLWLSRAANMPWLEISLSGRADWMANLFMFVPFGLLLAYTLGRNQRSPGGRVAAAVIGSLIVTALAFLIESLQLFVPQRTASLNDFLAGTLGGGLGIAIWLGAGDQIRTLVLESLRPARKTLLAGLTLYTLAYVLLSLFPYDFVVGFNEFARNIQSGNYALWVAAACSPANRCLGQLMIEVLAVLPIGMALALWRGWRPSPATAIHAAGVGMAFAVAIELAQFLTFSGISQGVSLLTRAAGFAAGALLIGWFSLHPPAEVKRILRPLAKVFWFPYILGLFWVVGLTAATWTDLPSATRQLQTLNFLPFYYHYFVREQAAMASLIYTLAIYLPVGMLLWPGSRPGDRRALLALVLAAGLALVVEGAKLMATGLRPDPTNLLIAGFAGWLGFRVFLWFEAALITMRQSVHRTIAANPSDRPISMRADLAATAQSTNADQEILTPASWPARILGILLLGTLAWLTLTWPTGAPWLAVGLAAYGAWLWRRPEAWLFVIPALVPTLNLSILTGRFLFDELDLFLLATTGVLLLRWRSGVGFPFVPRGIAWAMALFTLSVVVSLGLRMTPWPGFDANAWMHYSSEWNGVRVAKGFLWALVLFLLAGQSSVTPERIFKHWFVPGMVVGLAGVLGIVFWERLTYPGLANLDSNYRLTGFFAEMQAGGPSIEAYLVMATPFVLLWAWQRRRWVLLVPVLGLLAAALYALVVTYSRGGYVGMAVVVAIVLLGAWANLYIVGVKDRRQLLALTLLPLAVGAIVLPQVTGTVFEQRMAQIEKDFDLRVSHWRLVLDLGKRGQLGNVFGSGMGSFPSAYTWGNPHRDIPGNFSFLRSEGDAFLRMGSGDILYLNQRIRIPRQGSYTLELEASSNQAAHLHVFVCEKHIRHSFQCRKTRLAAPGPEGADAPSTWSFSADGLETGPWFARRQLGLSFTVLGRDRVIDIHRISLKSPDGREMLRNGDFSHGGRHWYFTAGHLWPWRTENQWLEIWFDQGWVGLFGFLLLTLIAFWKLLKRSASGSFEATTVLASLGGTLGVGIFSTVFWSPRLSMLFIVILLLGLAAVYQPRNRKRLSQPLPALHGARPDERSVWPGRSS